MNCELKLYGYSRLDSDTLLELREVTLCIDSNQARVLSEFLANCAKEMDENSNWNHRHFAGGHNTDLVVFNSHTLPE